MIKQKILCVINIIIGFYLSSVLFWMIFETPMDQSIVGINLIQTILTFIKYYGVNVTMVFLAILNFVVGSWAFLKLPKKAIPLQLVAMLSVPLYIVWIIATGFVVSGYILIFPLLASIIVWKAVKKLSGRVAIILSIMVLLATTLSYISMFEGSYCWLQGQIADPTGSKMMSVPNDGVVLPNNPGIEEHNTVGVAYYADIKCHKNFNFKNALLDSFNFRFVRI